MKVYVFIAGLLLLTSVGCKEQGSMENAGERADEIVDNAASGKPLLHEAGTAEKVGEAIDDTIDNIVVE